jgi:signal transduction histidine kinase
MSEYARKELVLRPNLLLRFSIISFAICALIALAFGWMLQQQLVNDALNQQAKDGGAVVDALLWNYLTPAQLAVPARGHEYNVLLEQISGLKQAEKDIVRIKVWNPGGIIVFSDQRSLVGRHFPVDGGLRRALGGWIASGVANLNEPENIAERNLKSPLLQAYVPIWDKASPSHRRVTGAYEIYHNMSVIQPRIDSIRRYVVVSVSLGFLILYLSLFAVVRNASRQLTRQSRENEAKAARLEVLNDMTRSISSNYGLSTICGSALVGMDRIVPGRPLAVAVQSPDGSLFTRSERIKNLSQPGAEALFHRVRTLADSRESWLVCREQSCGVDGDALFLCRDCAAFVSVPIELHDEIIGFLGVGISESPTGKSPLASDEFTALSEIALQMAAAVANARLLNSAAEAAALREVDRLKDEFISVVSHELRRPLASIKGYAATLLLDDTWDQPTRHDFLQVIDEESDRLSELVENLLDLSRLGSGMLTLSREPILLPKLAAAARDLIASQPHLDGHRFTMDFPEPFPTIEGDPMRVSQVLLNLVENAVKYSEPGTVVSLSGRVHPETGYVEVTIRDQGIGLRAEDAVRIFDRFYRVDNTLARKSQGTGLGLSICKGVVEAHGGTIWAESNGDGAAIRFTLPIAKSERKPSTTGALDGSSAEDVPEPSLPAQTS